MSLVITMIKFLVLDVDGTLTDGKIYMSNNGELFKAFDVKDGCGIKDILPTLGITPIIITARESKILENRCFELNIEELYQNTSHKLETLKNVIEKYNNEQKTNYTLENVAYMGDDRNDIPVMQEIKKQNGSIGCPSNAIKEVLELADYVSEKTGGNGAVRDFIEYLEKNR